MTTSKLPSLIGIRSISKDWFNKSAFLTQGMISSIPIVFSWDGSISPEGFLCSVLLWLVIIVAVLGVGVTVVVIVERSSGVKLSFSLMFRGGNIPFNTSRQSSDENFHHFLRIWHHSGTQDCQSLESSHICPEIIPFHSQMVKFIFHLLDLSSGIVLLYQKLLEFNPVAKLLKGLQTQMVEFQRQHGPAKGPAQPDAPGELADCIDLLFCLATQYRSFVQ
ncbi:hypothetical protein Tco_1159200, partial [Tanacetum coccineum]